MKKFRTIAMCFAIIACVSTNVFAASNVVGDLNDDGKVDILDLLSMEKYLANYNIEINEFSADIDNNSKVDILDLLMLEKYLSGWDVNLSKVVTISFDTNGGEDIDDVEVSSGTSLEELPEPIKSGSTFVAWCIDDEEVTSSKVYNSNATLIAKWK